VENDLFKRKQFFVLFMIYEMDGDDPTWLYNDIRSWFHETDKNVRLHSYRTILPSLRV
jgi:hypothetical protein